MDIQRRDFINRISKSTVVFGLGALWTSRSPGVWEARAGGPSTGLLTPFKAARQAMSQWGQYGIFIPLPKSESARKTLGNQLAALLSNPKYELKSGFVEAVYVCAPITSLGEGAKLAFGPKGDPNAHKHNVALLDHRGQVKAGTTIDWSNAEAASARLNHLLWSKSVQGPRLAAARDAEVEQWLKRAEAISLKANDPKKPQTVEEVVKDNKFWSKFHQWLRRDGRRACPTAAAWLQQREAREIRDGFSWRLRSVIEVSFDHAFTGQFEGTLPYGIKLGIKHKKTDMPSCPACGLFAAPPPTRVFLDFLTK